MNVAVSNLAWEPGENEAVRDVLAATRVEAIELAPTKTFENPLSASASEVARVLDFWGEAGICPVAFQSLLFGHPECMLFDTLEARDRTSSRLIGFIELAARMNVTRLVFGSPGNRRVPPGMDPSAADDIASTFFRLIAAAAERNGVVFCIEPNPVRYGCNFVTDSDEGASLVAAVDSPAFRLHLDAACMTLAGEDVGESLRRHADVLSHFHASAVDLGDLEDVMVDHAEAAAALADNDYRGWVSIEMRSRASGSNAVRVRDAVRLARLYYSVGRRDRVARDGAARSDSTAGRFSAHGAGDE